MTVRRAACHLAGPWVLSLDPPKVIELHPFSNNISGTVGNPLLDIQYIHNHMQEVTEWTSPLMLIFRSYVPPQSFQSFENFDAGIHIHLSDLSNWVWKWHIPNSEGFAKWFPLRCQSLAVHPLFWTQIPVATLTPRLAQRRSAALGSVGRTTPACSRLRGPHFYKLAVNHPKNGGLKGCGFIWLSLLLLLFTTVTSVSL